MSKKTKEKKGKGAGIVNVSKATLPFTEAQSLNQTQSLVSTLKQHPVFLIVSFVVAALVAIATIVPATGYVEEKWHETVATVDFSGDIDQQKPFSIPLVAKNPSQIFSMHLPRMSCKINVEYNAANGAPYHIAVFANQDGVTGAEIGPGGNADYFCDAPAALTITDKPGGTAVPIKQAEMMVILDYETWIPWSIKREVTTHFVMFATSSGFRWVKGDWLSGHPVVPRPPNLESNPPTLTIPPQTQPR